MIKLGDFVLAAQLEQFCLRRINQYGALPLMPRAVCYDEKTEQKSDVWSLGITLIELAEGKRPYSACSFVAEMEAMLLPAPTLSSSKWSAEFVDFVSKCLAKDVKERWSVSELMNVSSFTDE